MVTLPPGGVVRFEVNIATPPTSVLRNDLTSFLATGLELRTPDEVIPIAVRYDTVKGKIKLLPFEFRKYFSALILSDEELFNVKFSPTQYHANLMKEYEETFEIDGSGEVSCGWVVVCRGCCKELNDHHVTNPCETIQAISQPRYYDRYYVSSNKDNHDVFKFYNYWARLSKATLPRSGEIVDMLSISPILKQSNDNLEDELDPFIDLVLKKGSGRELTIRSIDSCNPWFNVTMLGLETLKKGLPPMRNDWWNKNDKYSTGNRSQVEVVNQTSGEGEDEELTVVGRLYHTITCGGSSMARYKHPFTFNSLSFWNCAYELVTKKAEMHKDGCGGIKSGGVGEDEINAIEEATEAIDALIKYQQQNDAGNAIQLLQLDLWEDAREAWATYTDLGLNKMGTSLYPSGSSDGGSGSGETSELAMSPLLVQSKLTPPQLLFGKYNEVVFEDVEVGEVAVGYAYVENPTGARLIACLTNEVADKGSYVQRTKSDHNSWFSSKGWSMRSEDPKNSILQVGYGNSIHTQVKDKWNYAVHGISHLLRGCTRRCGIKQEVTTPVSLFAPISPIVPENEDGTLNAYKVTKPHAFGMSYDANTRRVVGPYQIER
jgi:hypothetical protein